MNTGRLREIVDAAIGASNIDDVDTWYMDSDVEHMILTTAAATAEIAEADARFIATFDPQVVGALLDVVDMCASVGCQYDEDVTCLDDPDSDPAFRCGPCYARSVLAEVQP